MIMSKGSLVFSLRRRCVFECLSFKRNAMCLIQSSTGYFLTLLGFVPASEVYFKYQIDDYQSSLQRSSKLPSPHPHALQCLPCETDMVSRVMVVKTCSLARRLCTW